MKLEALCNVEHRLFDGKPFDVKRAVSSTTTAPISYFIRVCTQCIIISRPLIKKVSRKFLVELVTVSVEGQHALSLLQYLEIIINI